MTSEWKPYGTNVFVKKYVRPDNDGLITIPEHYRNDHNLSIWEVVKVGPDVGELLGIELKPDDIVKTAEWSGVCIEDYTTNPLFVIKAEQITSWYPCTWNEDQEC